MIKGMEDNYESIFLKIAHANARHKR